MKKNYTEADITALRERVRPYLTAKRYEHTLAVEREAEFLGKLYLPEKIMALRAAALLHDITKKCDLITLFCFLKNRLKRWCYQFG